MPGAAPVVPDWAKQYVRLGSSFARLHQNNSTDVLCLIVPIRSYAAVFFTVGALLEQLIVRIGSPEEYLDWISRQAPGTRIANGHRSASIVGVGEENGQPHVCVSIGRAGSKNHYLSRLPARAIMAWTPKNAIRPDPSSLATCLSGHLVNDQENWLISTKTDPSVVLVGNVKTLRDELRTEFTSENDRSPETLQILIRANEYQYQMTDRRTRIESSRSRSPDPTGAVPEKIVVFDGGQAYLNRAHEFHHADQVIIVEFGDPRLSEVIDLLDQRWLDRVEDGALTSRRLSSPPPGCEIGHFQVSL